MLTGALLAALLAAGVAVGLGLAEAAARDRSAAGSARPLEAASPSVPVDVVPTPAPDPDAAPLAADLALAPYELGTGPSAVTVLAPEGWNRKEGAFPNESQWVVPGLPRFTHFLRIEQLGTQHSTAPEMVADKIEEVSGLQGMTVIEEGEDRLHVSYLLDGHLRHVMLRWLDIRDDPRQGLPTQHVELEIAASGRAVDLPGLRDLVDGVAEGIGAEYR